MAMVYLTVVQEEGKDKFKVLENVSTMKGARTMGVDLKTRAVLYPLPNMAINPSRLPITHIRVRQLSRELLLLLR